MGEQAAMVVMTEDRLRSIVAEAIRDALANTNGGGISEYMTLDQVAELLMVHTRTVRNWVAADGLPALRAGKEYRFRRSAVVGWLDAKTTKPGAHLTKHITRLNRVKAGG